MSNSFDRVHLDQFQNLPEVQIAFQPIVNVVQERVVAYEALTRGMGGVCFPQLVANMDSETLLRFHRKTAAAAIRSAVQLGLNDLNVSLCVNMMPDLRAGAPDAEFMLESVNQYGLNPSLLVIELTEDHHFGQADLQDLLCKNRNAGFATGMDDFGAGYAGLTMLVACRPDLLKLDRVLIRGIDKDETRQMVIRAVRQLCAPLGMTLVAEGVETVEECRMLRKLGIALMQGYYFARPVVNEFATPVWMEKSSVGATRTTFRKGALQSWMTANASPVNELVMTVN